MHSLIGLHNLPFEVSVTKYILRVARVVSLTQKPTWGNRVPFCLLPLPCARMCVWTCLLFASLILKKTLKLVHFVG